MRSEDTLGVRIARQADGAIEEAFALYAPSVRSYVARFVGADDADDVVQRTFVDLWRYRGRYDPTHRFTSWLFTLARRRAIDSLRSRRHDVVDADVLRDLVGEDGRVTAERHADAAQVRAAVARLPEHERTVIELTYFADLSQAEIASRLGAPLGTVKARASRGTKRLGRLIAAEMREDTDSGQQKGGDR